MNGRGHSAPADGVLVERARRGDEAAWRALVERHRPILVSIARRHRLGEADTADVVQTTWLRCVENLHGLREPQALGAWLATTCRRECVSTVRRASRVTPQDTTNSGNVLASIVDQAADDGYAQIWRGDDARRLHAAVGDLPGRQRRVVLELMHHGDDGYAAAARRLGIPVGSLGPTRRRALERLRLDARLAPTG